MLCDAEQRARMINSTSLRNIEIMAWWEALSTTDSSYDQKTATIARRFQLAKQTVKNLITSMTEPPFYKIFQDKSSGKVCPLAAISELTNSNVA